MKKLFNIFIVFLLGFVLVGGKSQVFAESCGVDSSGLGVTLTEHPFTTEHTIIIDLNSGNFPQGDDYQIIIEGNTGINQATTPKFDIDTNLGSCDASGCITVNNRKITWDITDQDVFERAWGQGDIDTKYVDLEGPHGQCDLGKINIGEEETPGDAQCKIDYIKQTRNSPSQTCFQNAQQNACFATGENITVKISNLQNANGEPFNGDVRFTVSQSDGGGEGGAKDGNDAVDGTVILTHKPDVSSSEGATFEYQLISTSGKNEDFNCSFSINVYPGCSPDKCNTDPVSIGGEGGTPETLYADTFSLCNQIPEEFEEQRTECLNCTGGGDIDNEENLGVWTAIGCINREPQAIMQRLISVGLGMSGGVALLTFLAAGFIFSTSQGDPKAYGKAKDMMTAAIVGLIFVIFSVTLLQFIGYEIFKIPGFGGQ